MAAYTLLRKYLFNKYHKLLFLVILCLLICCYRKVARETFDIQKQKALSNSIVFQPRKNFIQYYDRADPFHEDYSISIQFMTPFFGHWDEAYSHVLNYNTHNSCPWKCHFANITDNPSSSDVLIYHANALKSQYFPKTRSPHQIWMLFTGESPWKVPARMSDFNYVFNWTCFVRFDSDLVLTYGQSQMTNITLGVPKLRPRKKSVYWMASNCGTMTDRDIYVEELKRYITVDVYGGCLPDAMTCSRSDENCNRYNGNNYNFYLAFENAVCRNYITEKFWRCLEKGVIPVVMGDSQSYKELAPPNSYIDVADFQSPKQLALYLQQVLSNVTLYRGYFAWKQHYKVSQTWQCFDCELCKALHKWNGRRQVYKDLSGWHNQDYCPSWSGWNQLKVYHAWTSYFGRRIRRLIS